MLWRNFLKDYYLALATSQGFLSIHLKQCFFGLSSKAVRKRITTCMGAKMFRIPVLHTSYDVICIPFASYFTMLCTTHFSLWEIKCLAKTCFVTMWGHFISTYSNFNVIRSLCICAHILFLVAQGNKDRTTHGKGLACWTNVHMHVLYVSHYPKVGLAQLPQLYMLPCQKQK